MRNFLLVLAFIVPTSIAQAPPSRDNVEALRYDSTDSPPPPIRMADIDRVRLAYVSAQLGKSGASRYPNLSEEDKNKLFIEAFTPYNDKMSAEREKILAKKQMHQLMRSWRLNLDKLMASPKYVNDLNEWLDDDSVRSSKIVQDFLIAHKEKLDRLSPLDLLGLQARVASVYLRRDGITGTCIFVAVLPNPILRTELRAFFQDDLEMKNFWASHKTVEQMTQGIRDQLLLFTLRILLPETEKNWGKLQNFKMLIGEDIFPIEFTGKYSDGGRSEIDTVLGTKGAKLFDAGIFEPGMESPSATEEKQANRYRLYGIAVVLDQLNGAVWPVLDAPIH